MTLNFKSKKYFIVFIVFAFLVNIANAQVVKVNKKVLLFKIFGGDNDVYEPVPYDSTKTQINPSKHGMDEYFMTGIMPFSVTLPLEIYLEDLHSNPPRYMYNDVFIYKKGDYDFPSIEGTNITKEIILKQPLLDIKELDKSDVPYVYSKNLGAVAKFWVLDAEWEMHTVKKIPGAIRGLAPMNLIFENYHIYMLTKINGISVVPKSPYRSSYAPLVYGQLKSRIKSK